MTSKLKDIDIENHIWIIYLIIIVASWYSNSLEKAYFLYNDQECKNKYRQLMIKIFLILIIVYIYFFKSSLAGIYELTSSDSTKKALLTKLSMFASFLILISGIIYLYIAYMDQDIDVEIAFNWYGLLDISLIQLYRKWGEMKKYFLNFVCAILAIFILIPQVEAFSYGKSGENFTQEGNYESTRLIAGNTVKNAATIDGISLGAGNDIEASGHVTYGFYAGNLVKVNETVEKDLFVAGNSILIDASSTLGRDVFVAGNKVTINANIPRNLNMGASAVNISGAIIGGNATIYAENIVMDAETVITGTFTYPKTAKITGLDLAQVGNTKTVDTKEAKIEISPMNRLYTFIITIVAAFIVLLVLFYILPTSKEKLLSTNLEPKNVAKTMGIGLIVLIVVPILSFLGMMTGFLTPLGLITFAVYIIACYLSTYLSSMVVGSVITTKLLKNDSTYIALIIGIILIKLLKLIPIVGGWVGAIAVFYGMGLVYKYIANRNK